MISPLNIDEVRARLAAVEQRLEVHAARTAPTGLTQPGEGGSERWEAGQVWAHLAEFPAYWLGQLDHVIRAAEAGEREPIPFGRTTTDPGRLGAIERDRREAPQRLLERIREALERARGVLLDYLPPQWDRLGAHPTLGEMPASRIFERFIVEHLEEHAAQLDYLVERHGASEGAQPSDVDPGERLP